MFPHLPGERLYTSLEVRLLLLLLLLLLVPKLLNCERQSAVGTAGLQLYELQASTSSSRPQWALPDLNSELQISVGSSGP